jgi:hypothetical protein
VRGLVPSIRKALPPQGAIVKVPPSQCWRADPLTPAGLCCTARRSSSSTVGKSSLPGKWRGRSMSAAAAGGHSRGGSGAATMSQLPTLRAASHPLDEWRVSGFAAGFLNACHFSFPPGQHSGGPATHNRRALPEGTTLCALLGARMFESSAAWTKRGGAAGVEPVGAAASWRGHAIAGSWLGGGRRVNSSADPVTGIMCCLRGSPQAEISIA